MRALGGGGAGGENGTRTSPTAGVAGADRPLSRHSRLRTRAGARPRERELIVLCSRPATDTPHSPRSAAAGAPTSAGAPAAEARAGPEPPRLGSARAAARPPPHVVAGGLSGSEACAARRPTPPAPGPGASIPTGMPALRKKKSRSREGKTSCRLGYARAWCLHPHSPTRAHCHPSLAVQTPAPVLETLRRHTAGQRLGERGSWDGPGVVVLSCRPPRSTHTPPPHPPFYKGGNRP